MKTKIKKVLLVINPVSGDIDKQPIINTVKQFLSHEARLKEYKTTGEDDIDRLRKEVKTFGPDRIVVVGGDGTIKMAAQACTNYNTIIGIIPAGSANGLATDLGLPEDCKKAMVVAMGQETKKVDALCMGDSIGLHISDLGINAELIKKYSENKVRGHFGYFLSSIPTLRETEGPYHFTITANGEEREVDAIMVAFANSKKFGTGALVNPDGKINDGRFEVLIFKEWDVVEIMRTLIGKIEMNADFVEVISTTEAHVTTDQPVSFQIDGEPHAELQEVSISIIPGFIEIATGV